MSNSNINLNVITDNTVLASTFAQAAYPRTDGSTFAPPDGFEKLSFSQGSFNQISEGFAAETYYNKVTGEVVIAYRGSDTVGEAIGVAAYSASTGSWNPQFTDATNYAAQAKAQVLAKINEYRDENKLQHLEVNDLTPLITGHSLGGLLGEVVSKMFGWPAEVFDSLGGGKLVYTTNENGDRVFGKEFTDQAKALGLTDADGKVIDHNVSGMVTNYATSGASSVGEQLGNTVDIPALGQMGGMGSLASMSLFVLNPVGGALTLLAQQEVAQHSKFAIEESMYGLAALKPLVADAGDLHVQTMPQTQATGQASGDSNSNVLALLNDKNEVVAYVSKTDGVYCGIFDSANDSRMRRVA